MKVTITTGSGKPEYKKPSRAAVVIDKIVEAVAPQWGLRRALARQGLTTLSHKGAYPNDLRGNSSIHSSGTGQSWRADRERKALAWNAIELIENSGLASTIRQKIINYTVGSIRAQCRTGDAGVNSEYEDYLQTTLGKRIDYSGNNTFRQLMGLGVGGQIVKGDFGLNVVREGGELFFQGIEAERIGNPYDWSVSPRYYGGVELGPGNRHEAYHIYKRDPMSGTYSFDMRAPARSEQGLPQFFLSVNRSSYDEVRGTSVFKTAINNIDYIERIREYELQALAWASSNSGVYYTNSGRLPSELPFDLTETETDASGNVLSRFSAKPNTITAMGTAERVEMFDHNRTSPNVLAMYRSTIRDIAAGVNLSYGFVYDMSGLSGPGVRFHSSQDKRTIVSWQNNLSEDVLIPGVILVLGEGIANGVIPFHPNFTRFGFLFPEYPTIDAGRESAAGVNEYLECLTTGAKFVEEGGGDIGEVQAQKGAEIENLIKIAKGIAARAGADNWREILGYLRTNKAVQMSPIFEASRAEDRAEETAASADEAQAGATSDGSALP